MQHSRVARIVLHFCVVILASNMHKQSCRVQQIRHCQQKQFVSHQSNCHIYLLPVCSNISSKFVASFYKLYCSSCFSTSGALLYFTIDWLGFGQAILNIQHCCQLLPHAIFKHATFACMQTRLTVSYLICQAGLQAKNALVLESSLIFKIWSSFRNNTKNDTTEISQT